MLLTILVVQTNVVKNLTLNLRNQLLNHLNHAMNQKNQNHVLNQRYPNHVTGNVDQTSSADVDVYIGVNAFENVYSDVHVNV